MPRWLYRFLMSVCLSICPAGAATDNTSVWNLPRFTADGNRVNEMADKVKVKPGTDVVVLDEEDSYVFDADGKAAHTHYLAYKVVTQKGAEGWDAIAMRWEPWHEERPAVRARVVTPDDAVHPLDPKTIADASARDENEKTYGDGRILRAPLPAIAPGSVVEEEEVSRESVPLFGTGVVVRSYFGRMVPVEQSKLAIDLPTTLPMRYSLRLLPDMKPQRSEANGRTQVLFEHGPMDALDEAEDYLPSDTPAQPQVTFSTGASWQAIAEGYGKTVDEKAVLKDVQPLVSRLVSGKSTREEKVGEVLQYLSREIRYTGVEFGDATIIPHAPAETLKHRYGDCKDKATLLVAMLRAAGIPAYLALLNAGQRQDVDAELPGMGLFDHAIVYAPGSPDLWIDPTDEHARLGQLPPTDQGRLALIARPESTSLVSIPEASSHDNLIVEKRDFYLAENGPARVVETTEPYGAFESEFRTAYADADDKDRRKNLKDYVANEYLSEKLARIERSDPRDLAKPFRLVIEADTAKRGWTDLESAVAAIRVESLFYRLPNELQEREKEEQKEAEGTRDKPKKARVADYQLLGAFTYEWQYRIVPPLGFQAKPLPPNSKSLLGPAILSEEFAAENDGAVRVTMRFDTVKRRFTAAEAKELKEKVAQIREGPAIFIYFEPTAQALMNHGKMKEAFQATRNLIIQHPKDAVHHLQRAKMLLAGGMGQAARDEARAAVKAEPNSALAQKTLAEILEYDLVGREYRRGSDLAGAEAAFRAAKKLDPHDEEITGDLAILLEYNQEGERYGPGAKLKESAEEYKSLNAEELGKIGLKNNPAFTFFYAGDFAGAKRYAESLNPQLNGVIVASETALNGTEAGMAEARKRTGSEADLKIVLKGAAELLMRAQKYPAAAALMEAGASGSNASNSIALAATLKKTIPHEQIKYEEDPEDAVKQFEVLIFDPQLTSQKMMGILSRSARKVWQKYDAEKTEQILRAGRAGRNALSRTGLPADVLLDISLQVMEAKAEGNDREGYRVTLRRPGQRNMTMYVVKEDDKYKVLDTGDVPNAVAYEVLDRLQAGNSGGARILLDWVREEQHLGGGDDPLSGSAFPRLWTKGKEADAEHMKLAAAALLGQSSETARDAVAILEPAFNTSTIETEKVSLGLGLLDAYRNLDAYEKVEAIASEFAKLYPESKRLFFAREIAMRGLGRFAEADALAQELRKRLPDDLDVTRAFVSTAVAREDYASVHELDRKLIDSGKAEASDLNNMAWYALFTGKIEQKDLEAATKGAQLSQNSPSILHTLGCVYAELGKTKEAREVLIQAMDQLFLDEPDANYWYAFGRVAEQYGENEVAASDYKVVKKPKKAIEMPGSSYRLAQIRLTAMGGSTGKKSP